MNQFFLLFIPLSPLIAAIIIGFGGLIIGRRASHMLAILGVLIAFFLSLKLASSISSIGGYSFTLYEWIKLDSFSLELGFLIDQLSIWMMLIVTFVSLMVHVYTVGYMPHDDGYQRFFSYISLFTFAMLILVMSSNLLQMFFAWEFVGFISYLLIGFWYQKPAAIYANMKAFLVNRVGDIGFLLGMGLIFSHTGSLGYKDIFQFQASLNAVYFIGQDWSVLTVACICLFVGAMAKSAQFPLHIWLPDSMEGPTPISALIHAATMVTSGIFMVARMSPLFEYSDIVLSIMMIIGSITALLMGLVGLVQNDIKRVIAYSTLSQLGYMTAALGASVYSLAIFHLLTHAFFKALLFLSAGSVVLGMHHNQDIRQMGGLCKYMPITWFTYLVGSLSLVGIPFFSGFYSKESIIDAVSKSNLFGASFAHFSLLISVFITSLYTFRMFFAVFHGSSRFNFSYSYEKKYALPTESSWTMLIPLLILSIPSVLFGAMFAGDFISKSVFSWKGIAYSSVVHVNQNHKSMYAIANSYNGFLGMAIHSILTPAFWLSLFGIFVSWWSYFKQPKLPLILKRYLRPIFQIIHDKYYIDILVHRFLVKGLRKLSYVFWQYVDISMIDKVVSIVASGMLWISSKLRLIQTGFIYHYAYAMIFGLLIFCLFPIYLC